MSETNRLYKTAVIGDAASVAGFAALGLSVFTISPKEGAERVSKLINRLAANDFAVIYITEPASKRLPSIVLIPAIEGNTGDGMRALHEAVEKAVGSDILN